MTDSTTLFDFDAYRGTAPSRRRARRQAATQARTTAQWPLNDGINVVLFAGLGGACQGLEDAGLPVHVAVNHDPVAIATHRALNPHTRHIQGDIFDIDPLAATQGQPVNDLWASPDCRDHSVAKGGAPRSPRVRSMPWQVTRWAGKVAPKRIYIENVREIRGWGPLRAKRDKATGRVLKLDGTIAAPGERVPLREQQLVRDPRRLGHHFRRWVASLRALGYDYEDRDLCCADFGVPTSRRRFFAVSRCDGQPIAWPERTHAPRHLAGGLGLKPWVAAATIIDWSRPLPSIFERKKPLAEATLRRIARGLVRYVIDCAEPFIVSVANTGTTGRGAYTWPVSDPLRTNTTSDSHALAGPAIMPITHTGERMPQDAAADPMPTITTAHRGELAVMGAAIVGAGGRAAQTQPMDAAEPLNASTTKEDRLLVGAELAAFAVPNNTNNAPVSPTDPLPTWTTANRIYLSAAHLTKFRNGATGEAMDQPLPTVTANGHSPTRPGCAIPLGVVGAALVQTGYGEREGQAPRSMDIADPIGTQVAGASKHALVGAFLSRYHGERRDGETRGGDAADPVPTQTTENRFAVVGAALAEHRGNSVGQHLAEPLGAQTQVAHHALVGAWLPQNNTGVVGHSPNEPTSTTVTTTGPQAVAGAYLIHQRGTSSALPADGPLPTVTTGGNRGGDHIGQVAAFLTKYYGTGGQDQSAQSPLGALSTADRFGIVGVTIAGQAYVVADIGMRMLEPEEAAAAHELRLPDTIEINGVRRALTKTEKMRLVGNSVPKRMARLLAEANSRHAITGRASAGATA